MCIDHAPQPYVSNIIYGTASTHEHLSFFQRVLDTIIAPIRLIQAMKSGIIKKDAIMSELGITLYTGFANRWRHGLVLVNNFFGFEAS